MKLRYHFLIVFISLVLVSCDVFFQPGDVEPSPTSTIVATMDIKETVVPEATLTSIPSNTLTSIPPSPTPNQTDLKPTEMSVDDDPDGTEGTEDQLAFGVQPGSPIRMHAWIHGCSWLGVAGQVFNSVGQPIEGVIVEAGGNLAGQNILGLSITGLVSEYGPGGYEIKLLDQPVESSNTVWVQLFETSGQLLSEKIYLDTRDDCNQNLIVLNFVEVESLPVRVYYFPLAGK